MKFFNNSISSISRIVLASVLLLAAGTKGSDLVAFSRQLDALFHALNLDSLFGTLNSTYVLISIVVVFLEFILAALLYSGVALHITSKTTLGLCVIFTLLNIAQLFSAEVINCGCFGSLLTRTPIVAVIENLFLIALAYFAGKNELPASIGRKWIAVTVVILGIGYTTFYQFNPPEWAVIRPGSVLKPDLTHIPIEKKDALLWLFDPNCHECQAIVGTLDLLNARSPGIDIFGITAVSQGRLDEFLYDFDPSFLVLRADSVKFHKLGVSTGSLLLVRNRTVKRIWSAEQIPRPNDLKEILQNE